MDYRHTHYLTIQPLPPTVPYTFVIRRLRGVLERNARTPLEQSRWSTWFSVEPTCCDLPNASLFGGSTALRGIPHSLRFPPACEGRSPEMNVYLKIWRNGLCCIGYFENAVQNTLYPLEEGVAGLHGYDRFFFGTVRFMTAWVGKSEAQATSQRVHQYFEDTIVPDKWYVASGTRKDRDAFVTEVFAEVWDMVMAS